jgi:1,4-dihydroxy-2-naphthoate octaprenyltransferase
MLPFIYLANRSASNAEMTATIVKFVPVAIQVSALATNIIVVNNLRDRHTDVVANKRTLAVRFGAKFCRIEYVTNVAIAYGFVVLDWMNHSFAVVRLLPLMTFPLARKEIHAVFNKEGKHLNPHVGGSAKVQLLFCIFLALTIRIS